MTLKAKNAPEGKFGMVEDKAPYEHRMRVWEIQVASQAQLFGIHLAAVSDFASLAIKSIILANSAAAGAVLAFLATMWGEPGADLVAGPALHSTTIFAAGVLASMVSAALSYCAQYSYALVDWGADDSPWKPWLQRIGVVFHIIAVLAAATGIASFGIGAAEGLDALEAARGGLGVQLEQPASQN